MIELTNDNYDSSLYRFRDSKGILWERYETSFSDNAGNQFDVPLWATSFEHAEELLGKIKQTAMIKGKSL